MAVVPLTDAQRESVAAMVAAGELRPVVPDEHKARAFLAGAEPAQHVGRQAAAFRAEQEAIARLVAALVKALRTLGGQCEYAFRIECRQTIRQSVVHLQRRKLVIIQAGTNQLLVFQGETERFDQVQSAAGIGAQPDDIAGIRRNLGLVKNDIEHEKYPLSPCQYQKKRLTSVYRNAVLQDNRFRRNYGASGKSSLR